MIRYTMPWKAIGPGDLTLISSKRLLAKVITEDAIADYDDPYWFSVGLAARLDCVEDIAELLAMIAGDPHTCIIRGALRYPVAATAEVLRRCRTPPAPFAASARCSLMVDCDGMPTPPGVDPTDAIMAGGVLRRSLPPPFRAARAVVQLSSTAGLKPGVVKGHLWFWLDRPVSDAEAKRWLRGAPVDTSIYQPVGIHYTASPCFVGVDDPCHERIDVLPGYAEVAVPDLPDPERPRATLAPAEQRSYAPPRRGIGVRATRPEFYMLACLRAVVDARAGDRHPTIVRVAARLFGLAKSGALDPGDVAARIKGAVLLSSFDRDQAEVDSALQWAWEQSTPWRLP